MRSFSSFAWVGVAGVVLGCGGLAEEAAPALDAGADVHADADWTSCARNRDCVVRPASCCGNCGAAAPGDAIAIASDHAADYASSACSGGQGCNPCVRETPATLLGDCAAGACGLTDWSTHPANACRVDADCRVRAASCCECGADMSWSKLLAVPRDVGDAFMALVCDGDEACDMCLPLYPRDALAVCSGGYCAVSFYVN